MSYWALGDVLGPLVHVGAPLNSGTELLLVIPATVRVPRFHAMTNMSVDRHLISNYLISVCVRQSLGCV